MASVLHPGRFLEPRLKGPEREKLLPWQYQWKPIYVWFAMFSFSPKENENFFCVAREIYGAQPSVQVVLRTPPSGLNFSLLACTIYCAQHSFLRD